MRRWRAGALVAGALSVIVGSPSVAMAGTSQLAVGADGTIVAKQAVDSVAFSGDTAAVKIFTLIAGRYFIDAYAQYDALNDPNGAGNCLFSGYLDDMQTGSHAALGGPAPITPYVPYSQTATGYLAGGPYRLVMLPFTNCDWRVSIVPTGPSSPSLSIQSVGVYRMSNGKLVQTTVVPFGPTVYFIVSYGVSGKLPGPLSGELTLQEKSGPLQKANLKGEGVEKAYLSATFSVKEHDVPGPAVATFILTAGNLLASRVLRFTLENALGTPSG
jgi:hypothetical protein